VTQVTFGDRHQKASAKFDITTDGDSKTAIGVGNGYDESSLNVAVRDFAHRNIKEPSKSQLPAAIRKRAVSTRQSYDKDQTNPAQFSTPIANHVSQGEVFISYASPDRPIAEALALALSKEGWSVWWDRTIPPGKNFDQVIEAALTRAKCVIVLWSKTSVDSEWVKVEAADAAKRHILIPAMISQVTIPLEFRRLQAADLIGWHGTNEHAGFQILVESVADLVSGSCASRKSRNV